MRFLLILCLFFSACSKTPAPSSRNQVARLLFSMDPTSLDPRKARDLESTALLHMLFEGLTRTSQKGLTELALAESVQVSEDGLCYTFLLKETRWSNGQRLIAEDFASSWKAILNPEFPTDLAYHLYVIKNGKKAKLGELSLDEVGVYAQDERTLVVELEQPTPYFLQLLTMTPFFPIPSKIAAQNPDWANQPASFVSNGPFLLRTWNYSDSLALTKNFSYWEAEKVSLDGVDLFIASPDTGLRMFEEGKLDWTGSPLAILPPDAIAALKEEKKLQVAPFAATYFFRVNTSATIDGKPNPLANPKLRKALSAALDRKAITEHILQGGHQPATHLVPPEMGLAAEEIFSEISEIGQMEPVVLSYINSERNAAIAQAVQKEWESALGIAVKLEAVESKTYFQRVSQKQYQIAAGSWTADFDDPINFLEVFKYKEGSTNNTGWENAEYIDLLDRSALCRDSEERRKLLCQAEKILLGEMPIIPLFHFALNYLKEERLKGVVLSPLGQLDLRWASLEP